MQFFDSTYSGLELEIGGYKYLFGLICLQTKKYGTLEPDDGSVWKERLLL
jgi:hypothetical protein